MNLSVMHYLCNLKIQPIYDSECILNLDRVLYNTGYQRFVCSLLISSALYQQRKYIYAFDFK